MRARLTILALVVLAGCASEKNEAEMAEPAICGGLQGLACGPAEYCAYPQTGFCGAADQTGVCMPRPEVCTMEYNPICGCDDQTYSTACVAAAAGVSVAYPGECQR
jgi:Kazal-type serine protease inhibitor domain